jgi:hypothetical protein
MRRAISQTGSNSLAMLLFKHGTAGQVSCLHAQKAFLQACKQQCPPCHLPFDASS